MSKLNDSLKSAAELIRQADALIITAGAGMGVDSGLPDFRGDHGFWKAYPALGESKIKFKEIASPFMFIAKPELAWGFYGHRLELYRKTQPHEGFAILKAWGENKRHGYFVYTSNVDGQFQKAGFDEDRIVECHGSIHHLQCIKPCCKDIRATDDLDPQINLKTCHMTNPLPLCPRCGAIARPNILMFDDGAWVELRTQEQQERLAAWMKRSANPVIMELGAGTTVPTVRYFNQMIARECGCCLIRINPQEWDVSSDKDVGIQSGALQALSGIQQYLSI